MPIGPACRLLGFAVVLFHGVACNVNLAPDGADPRPSLDATALDDLSMDDRDLSDPIDPSQLEVTATTTFCCDPYERVLEARFTGPVDVAQATCHWDFDDGRSADGCRVRHRFNWAGQYAPSVIVVMSNGAELNGTVEVTVGPAGEYVPEDGNPGDPDSLRIEYLTGPEGDTLPGMHEVSWRFAEAAAYSDVRLVMGCCDCPADDGPVLTPDDAGIFTTTVDIPDDRSAWYFVRYKRDGVGYEGPAIHTTVSLSQASLAARPTVIWSHVGSRDSSDGLAKALGTGLITDVAIFAGNRETSDTLDTAETREAIAIARQAGVELILVRTLWQTQPGPEAELTTIYDANYYVNEIARLREDADRIGAARVGFDAEAYGPTPLTEYFRLPDGFSTGDFEVLVGAVDGAVNHAGQVDFILPAGSIRENHPYNALFRLGRKRIADGTYYDNEQDINWIPYAYDLAAMYVNVTKDNPAWPVKPYFLPSEVFGGKAHIWTGTEGLVIWPREGRAEDVADLLAVFAGVCPANPNSW